MKSPIITLSFLFVASVLVSACLPDEEKQNHGTVLGVTACINKNSNQSELISETLVKEQCINKHEQILNLIFNQENLASVDVKETEIIVYASTLVNNFDDVVITSVELAGCYNDANGEEKCKSKWLHDIWVEPNKVFSGTVKIPYDYKGPKIELWCSNLEDKKNCKSWSILRAKGLKIKLK